MEPSFEPIGPRRTFEGAVEQIAEKIRLGEIRSGDRLPSERDLAAAMHISRATLREAVKVLSDAGLLEVRTGSAGGIFAISDYVGLGLLRTESDIRVGEVAGILEARRLLEPRVAQLAAVNAREEDFALLDGNLDAMKKLVAQKGGFDPDQLYQLDTQFHLHIARASGNSTVVSLMKTIVQQLELARHLVLRGPQDTEWVIDIHTRTLAAIRSADHARIEEVMDEHLAANEQAWEEITDRVLIRPVPDFLRPIADRANHQDS
jgi:GntR family transcriptional regulator, transcriptional repressor for pyruvate dehydrogenase complex